MAIANLKKCSFYFALAILISVTISSCGDTLDDCVDDCFAAYETCQPYTTGECETKLNSCKTDCINSHSSLVGPGAIDYVQDASREPQPITRTELAPYEEQVSLMQGRTVEPSRYEPLAAIEFALVEGTEIKLEITRYDAPGETVKVLADGWYEAGRHTITWETDELVSGMYYYRLTTDAVIETKQLVWLK